MAISKPLDVLSSGSSCSMTATGTESASDTTATATASRTTGMSSKGNTPRLTVPRSKKSSMSVKQSSTSLAHPTYLDMVQIAVRELKDRKGSSRQAILQYMTRNFDIGNKDANINKCLRAALCSGVTKGALKQMKGTGASGSFRLGENATIGKAKPRKSVSDTSSGTKSSVSSVKSKRSATPKRATTPKKTAKKTPSGKALSAKKGTAAKKTTKRATTPAKKVDAVKVATSQKKKATKTVTPKRRSASVSSSKKSMKGRPGTPGRGRSAPITKETPAPAKRTSSATSARAVRMANRSGRK